MQGSNRSFQSRKQISVREIVPKVHGLTLLRQARPCRLASDMMFSYALCLSFGDARMGTNAAFGLRPSEPATQRSAFN